MTTVSVGVEWINNFHSDAYSQNQLRSGRCDIQAAHSLYGPCADRALSFT